ncbi:universal stress protein [Buchananella felis]|uniref:universal stress protein n=1 Tax=Buchananella felis TaxID=3231492 RepID=UPI003528F05C
MVSKEIVVGVDGSVESKDALQWAIDVAKAHEAPLRLVCAYSLPSFTAASLDGGFAIADDAAIESGARAVIDEAMARVRDAGIEAEADLETGDPAGVLVDRSKHAWLVVVGTRGGGGFADRLLGAVSSAVPAHAHCPVVVVPRHESGSEFTPIRRIVVGVDGSDVAARALSLAIDEAMLWNAELTAVAAVPMTTGMGTLSWIPTSVDRETVVADARAGLDATIESVLGGRDVNVRRHALDGNPAALLAEFSTAVDLVVVGTRGRGGFAGLLLGSTSQALLNHTTCPVMVVPGPNKKKEGEPSYTGRWSRR